MQDYVRKQKRPAVYFVGAGPGDPELITIKGRKVIEMADLIIYAGSLVPKEITYWAKPGSEVVDSSSLTLDEIHSLIVNAADKSALVARVHTGDPSLFGAIKEQMHLLSQSGIDYEIIPGVTAAFAAAARAKISFTLPEKTQTLILTRAAGRTPVPDKERLKDLSRHQCCLAIYLSASQSEKVAAELLEGGYPAHTPVIIACRVGWPGEKIVHTRLEDLPGTVKKENITKQAVFLVLPGLEEEPVCSKLYSPEFSHGFRT